MLDDLRDELAAEQRRVPIVFISAHDDDQTRQSALTAGAAAFLHKPFDDHALLDAVPENNRWRTEIDWRLTPIMTPLDRSPMFAAYDRPTIVAGPFIDQYARGGFQVGALRAHRWEVTGWAGTEPALSEAIFGGEAALLPPARLLPAHVCASPRRNRNESA